MAIDPQLVNLAPVSTPAPPKPRPTYTGSVKKPGPKPRSKPLKAPKKKAAPKPTDGSNSESEISDVEPVVKPKKKKKKSAIEYDLDEIVFMVPEATSYGNQRVALDSSHSFEDVVEIMHETIGGFGSDQQT
ncbi:hypothetical protein B0H14DRAFT_3444852 [Mycena olivaceomarginata]|nr:hypothetical protein B0H14DRAFT_3444852 [Mycena olivaceomarginata]